MVLIIGWGVIILVFDYQALSRLIHVALRAYFVGSGPDPGGNYMFNLLIRCADEVVSR